MRPEPRHRWTPPSAWTAVSPTTSCPPTPPAVLNVLLAPGPPPRSSPAHPATSWKVSVTPLTRPPVRNVHQTPHQPRTPLSAWTAPAGTLSTPALTRPGVRSVREVREPRRIVSAVTGLTVTGRAGDPGVSAPSPVLERMESQGPNIVSVSALHLNMEGRSVILLDIKRLSPALESRTV